MEASTSDAARRGGYLNSSNFNSSANYGPRSSSSLVRRLTSQNFINDSCNASLDIAYIPWQTLSSDVNEKLRHGSVKINRSNRLEWAGTINEEATEKAPLLRQGSELCASTVTDAVQGGISWKVAAFLLINAALGAGVLNYPHAYFRLGGVLTATLLQIVMMVILASTMFILIYCADLNKDASYHDVLLSMCGKRCQQLSAFSIMLTCYGICVTFLIIIGDQYDRIFVSHLTECVWYVDRRFTISITGFILILPMCYFQRLDFLKYAGTLGVFSMLYVVFLNVYEYILLKDQPSIKSEENETSTFSVIACIPVICFAYQCHEVVVPVYSCMEEKQRNMKNFAKATALTLGLLFFLYCMAGTFGYLTFGSSVTADIMVKYDARDPFVMIGVLALIIKMITTYPPMIVCGRGALDGLYAEFTNMPADVFINGEFRRRIIITTIWFVTSLLVALFTPNIAVVIELLGSLASANVFIFPSLCLMAISKRHASSLTKGVRVFFNCFALALILMGITTFILVLVQVHHDVVEASTKGITHDVLCK